MGKFNSLKEMYDALAQEAKGLKVELKAKPKEVIKQVEVVKEVPVEVIKEIEVIREVPVEIVKEVEVVKYPDMNELLAMMQNMSTSEVSRTVVKEKTKKGKASTRTVASKSKSSKRTTGKSTGKKDDLKKIEGIGPKIEGILNEDGITTFKQLAMTKAEHITVLLVQAGPRYRMHNPKTWPQQSQLAADGKWEELEKLQDELDGGK